MLSQPMHNDQIISKPPPPPPMILKRTTIPPMVTYKNFMLNQPDDVPPEVFQRRYEDFQVQYIMDFSTNFFENNKNEEWFRERYDPYKQYEMELETTKNIQIESTKFKSEFLAFTEQFMESLRLDPVKRPSVPLIITAATTSENKNEAELTVVSGDAMTTTDVADTDGIHIKSFYAYLQLYNMYMYLFILICLL